MTDHLERVARALPADASTIAYLHDVLERPGTTVEQLRASGVTEGEYAVLELLTHQPGQSYETYVRAIAEAPGGTGRLARMVKLADLDDHLRHRKIPADAPNYGWARRQIVLAQRRHRERLPALGTQAASPRDREPASRRADGGAP